MRYAVVVSCGRRRESALSALLAFPSGTVFKYPSEGILTRPPQTVASISAGKHRAKAVVDIRGDEGRRGSRRSANGVHHPGATAREGIRCARLSRERGTAVLALSGELWGASPPAATAEHQRRHRSHISGNGNQSAVRPRRLSCAARSRAFLGTNPAHLRRTGIPARPATQIRTAVQQERAVGVAQRRCLKK